MKALVTGSCGFIGSHLVKALINRGYEVFCLIRKTSNQVYSWREMLQFIAQTLNVNSPVIKIPFPALYTRAWISEAISKMTKTKPLVTRKNILSARRDHWLYDSQKIQNELGFKPEIGYKEGMKDIIYWYRQQGLL